MSQPLYFLAHETEQSIMKGGNLRHDRLRELGIDKAFEDCKGLTVDCGLAKVIGSTGEDVDHKTGVILFYTTPEGNVPEVCRYEPGLNWTKVNETVWIGIDPDRPPTPQEMRRKKKFTSYMEDEWRCAIVRRPDGSTELPCSFRFHNVGNQEVVYDQYRELYDDMGEVIEWFMKGKFNNGDFDKWRAVEMAIRVLGVSHRFSKVEQNAIGAVNTENFLMILAHSIDLMKHCRENDITLAAS